MNSLLSDNSRKTLSRYRWLRQLLGLRVAGKSLCLLYRLGLLGGRVKTYFVVSVDPPIIYIGNVLKHVFEIAEVMKDTPLVFIRNAYYTYETPGRIDELKGQVEQFRTRYPQHKLHFVCATRAEHRMFEEAGLVPATFMNKNALVDERLFTVQEGVAKEFDAVYNAQIFPVKRHYLAASIPRLALLGYQDPRLASEVAEYGEEVRESLKHAVWLNDIHHPIPPRDVPSVISRAKVGLCLSNEEGPMAASIEYLLCGLPVVSTQSLGGRDVFFDDDYALIVDDNVEAVSEAVQELIGRNLDPHMIRSRTLMKMIEHRQVFVDTVQSYIDAAGSSASFAAEFERIRTNKLRASAPFPGALFSHLSNGMPIHACKTQGESTIV